MAHSVHAQMFDDRPAMLLGELLDRWLKQIEHRIAARSLQRYKQIVKYCIRPRLGATSLTKLKKGAIEDLYLALLENGKSRGKGGLSPRSV